MKNKYPVYKERFLRQIDRISNHCKSNSPMMRIPPIAASECKTVLHYYYGGKWKTLFALFKAASHETYHSIKIILLMLICDKIGWTKVYHYPETDTTIEHYRRHGKNCSPNCQSFDCIDNAIPKWFKWITRWDKY